jgi:hypothetical protein
MGNTRNTGYLQNAVKVADNGDISLMHGNTMLMQISASGAITTTGVISGSNALSASYAVNATTASFASSATSASYALNATTSSYALSATSASFTIQSQTASSADAFTVRNTLTAQTLVVQTITSSVDFVTGSTRFGSLLDNTHVFTGSVSMTGSLAVITNGTEFQVGASGVTLGNAITDTHNITGSVKVTGSITAGGFTVSSTSNAALNVATNSTSSYSYVDLINNGASGKNYQIGVGGNGAASGYANNLYFDLVGVGSIMTFTSGSKVGIGTTNPSTLLQVAGLSTFGASNVNGDLTIISNGSPFAIRGRGDYDRPFLGLSWDTSPDTGVIYGNVLKFNTNTNWGTNAGTTALTILANGKVGIGETSPDNSYQGLTIKGSDPSLRLKTTSASGWVWTEYVNSSGTNNFSMGVNQTSPYFGIKAGAGMDNVHFAMDSSGNIGLGTSSPAAKLDVRGTTRLWHGNTTNYTEFNNSNEINHYAANGTAALMYLNWVVGGNVNIARNAIQATSGGNVGIGEGSNTIARLNVNGSTKMNRSFYNWYQGYWTGNSTYWHMKTSMWGGGSPNGNIQYTMSLFKGYMYSYSSVANNEGMVGFHNWSGTIYAPAYTGNLFSNVYISSDGYVVLVIPSGAGETGVTIDWHQAYAYPFVSAQVTAAGLHGSTTGKY